MYTHLCVHVYKPKLKVDEFMTGAGSSGIERHGQVDSAKGMYGVYVCVQRYVWCVCMCIKVCMVCMYVYRVAKTHRIP